MDRSVALVRTVSDAVGLHVEIMVDAWMGWDATYAVRLLERIAEYRPRWLEEPVPPDRPGDLAAIRRSSRVPIVAQEHEYTRWGCVRLLQAEAVNVLQADLDRCGGISELTKICTLASAFGRQVGPHGYSLPAALQVIAAQTPAVYPMAEYLVRMQLIVQGFHGAPLRPEGDAIPSPAEPGLGIEGPGMELDEAKIEERVELA